MAQISLESIKKIEKYRNTVHEKVHTTYTTFETVSYTHLTLPTKA